MYCNKCGSQITEGSRFCSECGNPMDEAQQTSTPVPNAGPADGTSSDTSHSITSSTTSMGTRDQVSGPKLVYARNPPLSPQLCWVNFLLPGVANMIHQQVAKGLVVMLLSIISLTFPPLVLLIVAVSILDAYMVGRTLKKGRPVSKWRFFPF